MAALHHHMGRGPVYGGGLPPASIAEEDEEGDYVDDYVNPAGGRADALPFLCIQLRRVVTTACRRAPRSGRAYGPILSLLAVENALSFQPQATNLSIAT